MDPLEGRFGDGPIIRPDVAQEMPMAATVIGRGPGGFDRKGRRVPMEVQRGDRVAVPWRTGIEIDINGTVGQYRFVREHEILGFVGESV